MITRHFGLVLAAAFLAGCVTEPKLVLQTQVPSGMTRKDVQLGILAATGLNLPQERQLESWQAMVDNALEMIPVYKSASESDDKKWIFETIEPSTIYASYKNGDEMLKARMDYTTSSITYRIDSSRSLRESGNTIHRQANTWLGDLKVKVARSLGRIQAMKMGHKDKGRDIQ